ncbi:DoxX family protein [Actinokineospora enzanensis]|uniref:DoxX family protein n=1 Tax=Actinokineospora enzanensis TaxID=155975 RepID=UPI0003768E78|nr:DoxX family protein [Actinokineospora enzanensis]
MIDQATTTTTTTPVDGRLFGAVLSVVRVVVGFLFICHGLQAFGSFGGIDTHGTAVEVGSWPGFYAGLIQVVGGALVLIGLFTRVTALVCSGSMAYAYFTVHAPLGLFPLANMGEQAALFAWVFLLIAAAGPGTYAVSTLLRRR